MFCLLEERYPSALGEIVLRLHSEADFAQLEHRGRETYVLTSGYELLIQRGSLPADWLPEWRPAGLQIASAAWGFYCGKRNTTAEQLTFTIGLDAPEATLEIGSAGGQWLTAIELASPTDQLHIGTQDEDWLASEAAAGTWVPRRLAAPLATYSLLVTSIEPSGLKTLLPALQEKEQFYFHYILAESARRKSVEYPDEWDISTWFCVDQTRQMMEKVWRHASTDFAAEK